MTSKNEKKADDSNYIPLSAFASLILPIPFVLYAFTLGYIHNFSIPVSPSLEESIYFGTEFIFGSIPTYPLATYIDFLSWQRPHWLVYVLGGLLLLVFIGQWIRSGSLKNSLKLIFSLVKRLWMAEVVVLVYFSFLYLNYEGATLAPYNAFMISDGKAFSAPPGTPIYLSRIVFGLLCILVFITPNFVDIVGRLMKSIFVHTTGFRLSVLFASALLAYHLTRTYAGSHMTLPSARMNGEVSEPQKIVWVKGETFYLLNCSGSLKVEGHADGKIFFSKDIDGGRNRTACSTLRHERLADPDRKLQNHSEK